MKKEAGITLVALVVTIVVLIILASVSINTISGENGIIVNATKAKFLTEVTDIQEQIKLAEIQENEGKKLGYGTLASIIERTDEYNEILYIENGEIVYDVEKVSKKQAEWLEEIDIEPKQGIIPIYTAEQLSKIGSEEDIKIEEAGGIIYNFKNNAHYIVQNDINLNGSEENQWISIGQSANGFEGILDGQNYTISNLYGSDTGQGVFRVNSGEIKNIILNNVILKGRVGQAGIASINYGKVNNCRITGDTEIVGEQSNGIIVANNYGEISNCYKNSNGTTNPLIATNNAEGIIKRCFSYSAATWAGIVGRNYGYVGECYNEGKVEAIVNTAGICSENHGTIEKCYNSGIVTGGSSTYGGIVANNKSTGIIRWCYNKGDVIGYVNKYTGGITNYNEGTIENCYNIGNITRSGISGTNIGTILNSYYLDTSAIKFYYDSNTGTIGEECGSKTESEMKTLEFVDLLNNSEEIFAIDTKNQNNGYPILKWQLE